VYPLLKKKRQFTVAGVAQAFLGKIPSIKYVQKYLNHPVLSGKFVSRWFA
jgi:hypothetical protein